MAYNKTFKNMHNNKSLTSLCCIAPVLAFVLLAGCNKVDTSKPNNDVSTSQPSGAIDTSKPNNKEIEAAIHDLYGSCPLWAVRNVRRIDGAPAGDKQSYAIASNFVLVLKDPAQLQRYVVQPGGRVLTSVEELSGFTNSPATSSDFKDCNLRAIGLMALNTPNHHIAAAYQVQEADLFVQSERGWHLLYTNTTGINFSRETAEAQDIRDVEPIVLTEGEAASPVVSSNTSTAKVPSGQSGSNATQSSSAEVNPGASTRENAGDRNVFHRLNLLVLSLLSHGNRADKGASTSNPPVATIATTGSEPAAASAVPDVASNPAPADNVVPAPVSAPASRQAATSAASAVALSVAEPVSIAAQPAAASAAMRGDDAGAPLPTQASAYADQAAKLQLLLRKARAEFNRMQYRSAVATTEAILLLDPANTQAQQLRARALRLEQESAVKASPPPAITAAQTQTPTLATTTTPAPQPVSRTLVPADLEGDWHGTYACGPYSGAGLVPDSDAWTHRVKLTIRNGRGQLVRQSHGEHPYREVLTGTVGPDLTLQLSGTGQYADAEHAWTTAFSGRFVGTTERPAFQADGALTNWRGDKTRTCHLVLGH
ncbi:hypothetical protein OKW45_006778 [Paraburkholderia sp. WSM4175]|uniref:hypothetical protein n=1 Tax=Paraburkholderia sp. WSM4175 TaxID=2991072 RepID=UPI003D25A1C7